MVLLGVIIKAVAIDDAGGSYLAWVNGLGRPRMPRRFGMPGRPATTQLDAEAIWDAWKVYHHTGGWHSSSEADSEAVDHGRYSKSRVEDVQFMYKVKAMEEHVGKSSGRS